MTTTTKLRIAMSVANSLIVGWLLYVAVSSFISIQWVAELSAADRSREIYGHVLLPLIGAGVVAGLAGIGWLVIGVFGEVLRPPGGVVKPAPAPNPAPNGGRFQQDIEKIRQISEAENRRAVEAAATVITLREPNIDLSITLTGDAAKDIAGRKKIGAVMEHYGSGAVATEAQNKPKYTSVGGFTTAELAAKGVEIKEPAKAEGGAV